MKSIGALRCRAAKTRLDSEIVSALEETRETRGEEEEESGGVGQP